MPRGAAAKRVEGPYARGKPRARTAPDGHRSNPDRFTDSGLHVVPWTKELALKAAGVDVSRPRAEQLAQIAEALERGDLPDQAVETLIWNGYPELG